MFPNLLLGQVLCDLILVHVLAALPLLPLDALDALALHVTRADQHALQGSQPEVVVTLGRQLLVTQPEENRRQPNVSRSPRHNFTVPNKSFKNHPYLIIC